MTAAQTAEVTSSGVVGIQGETQELSRLSRGLRVLVDQFRV